MQTKNNQTENSFLAATIAEIQQALLDLNFSKEKVEEAKTYFTNQIALSYIDSFQALASALRGGLRITPDGVAESVVLYACQLAENKQKTSSEEYRESLVEYIRKRTVGRVIGEAVIRYEFCMGTLKACFSEREIYCTPFWEGAEGIAFEEYDTNGANTFEPYVLPFKLTGKLSEDLHSFEKALEAELRVFTPKKNIG